MNSQTGLRHVLRAEEFERLELEYLFGLARSLPRRGNSLQGCIMASLFYEESTRTRLSFESAMLQLGGSVIGTENARLSSSVPKGESLHDTVRIISGYSDVIVLRHEENDSAERSSLVSKVPLINGGSGTEQHPTQALLDLFTLQKECGRLDGLTVAFVGDLKNGRTVRSLAYLLGKYKKIHIFFVSPEELTIGDDIKQYLVNCGHAWRDVRTIEEIIGDVDALYMTRIQKERFANLETYQRLKDVYHLDRTLAMRMRPGSTIMHPLPRNDEILVEVDSLPHAAYFRQADNGIAVRKALLHSLFVT